MRVGRWPPSESRPTKRDMPLQHAHKLCVDGAAFYGGTRRQYWIGYRGHGGLARRVLVMAHAPLGRIVLLAGIVLFAGVVLFQW